MQTNLRNPSDKVDSGLRELVRRLLSLQKLPVLFYDLDDTLNDGFGLDIEKDHSIRALKALKEAKGIISMNTGADIHWTGLRVLYYTEAFFHFDLLVLSAGRENFAWSQVQKAYLKLDFTAEDKGEGIMKALSFSGQDSGQAVFLGDFPGSADLTQPGIDDSVLEKPIGAIINLSPLRRLVKASGRTKLFQPFLEFPELVKWKGSAFCTQIVSETLLTEAPGLAGRLKDSFEEALEGKMELPSGMGKSLHWKYDEPLPVLPLDCNLHLGTPFPGLVYAGKVIDGKWERTYAIPLKPMARGRWEASILDPEVNSFTFINYLKPGPDKWEHKDYRLNRGE